MPVVYIPDSLRWQPTAEPEWGVESWSISTATQLFRGPRPSKKSAEEIIVRFQNLPGYTFMRLDRWVSQNMTASFPAIIGTYVGFRYGIPPAKGIPSLTSQSLSVTGKDTDTGLSVSGTVLYLANRTTWDWWEVKQPAILPRYNTVLVKQNPLSFIQSISVQPAADGSVPISAFTAIINALIPELVISDYQQEPVVPGAIWHCTSTIDYKLISSGS